MIFWEICNLHFMPKFRGRNQWTLGLATTKNELPCLYLVVYQLPFLELNVKATINIWIRLKNM
jgi:hypothetical protein